MSNFQEYMSHFSGLLTFQVFPDNPSTELRPGCIHTSDAVKVQKRLMNINAQGGGIYLTVNETDGTSRKASAVKRVRAVFVDLDAVRPDSISESKWDTLGLALSLSEGLDPHLIVESSLGKYHIYWMVKDFPVDKLKVVQKGVIEKLNYRDEGSSDERIKSMANIKLADEVIHDLPRVMRVPGFYHHKKDPVPVRLWEGYSSHHDPFTFGEITEVFKPYEKKERVISTEKAKRATDTVFGDIDIRHLNIVEYAAMHGMEPRHYDGERYHVTCPWSNEHSSTGKTDTVIWASPQWPQFSCSHNCCRGRDIRQLVAMFK